MRKLSSAAQSLSQRINEETKLGELRKIAKEIKKDHHLAMELWSTGKFKARQLAILILDKKQLDQQTIDAMVHDMQSHPTAERTHLVDWLMANQLTKDKRLISLMESWENNSSPLQRRIFWYYQARLRWMGDTKHENTEYLLSQIEQNLMTEDPEVQWAMNFLAGQIGKWQIDFRDRCIEIGETSGLYKDEIVPKNCTPNYLPEFIRIEVKKVMKQ